MGDFSGGFWEARSGLGLSLEFGGNTLTLYARWKSVKEQIKYSITYMPVKKVCGGDSYASNMPSPNPQIGTTIANSVKLSPSTPLRNRGVLTFAYWCSVEPSREFSGCSGRTYAPGSEYPLTGVTNDIVLWATWTIDGGVFEGAVDNNGCIVDTTIEPFPGGGGGEVVEPGP